MRGPAPRRRQRGIILVAVLLAVAIMAVMVVATAALTRSGIGGEDLEQRRLASHLALRSAIEAAKSLILSTPEDKRLLLDGRGMAVDLGNGVSATVSLRDAAGLADLNRSDPALIESVARFSGLGKRAADGLAEKITRLRSDAMPPDAGGTTQQPPGQPQPPGQQPPGQQPPPGQPGPPGQSNSGGANATDMAKPPPPPPIIFLSVDQMPELLDIEVDDALPLNEALTVYNPTGEINPFAAPDQVLQAIPGISERDISDIAMAKKSGKGAADLRLQQLTQRLPGMLTVKEPTVFMVEVTLGRGGNVLPGSAASAVVRLLPQGPAPFGTLALEEH